MHFLYLTFRQTKGIKMHLAGIQIITRTECAQILLKMATATNKTTATAQKLTATQRTARTIKVLTAKEERTAHESVLLANAQYKTEAKTLGFVYGTLKREYFSEERTPLAIAVREVVGEAFPTRTAFKKGYKAQSFHVWGGLQTLKRLNPVNKVKARIARQNKAEAKK